MKTSTSSPSRLRLWEAALFLAFGLTLTAGVWAGASEAALAGRVLRLHVIANSDSEADQARKLLVRDAVLSRAAQLLDGADGRQEAEAALAPIWTSWPRRGRTPWPGRETTTRSASIWPTSGSPPRNTTAFPSPPGNTGRCG